MPKYVANPTGEKFHQDTSSTFKLVMSAVGCGKTVICVNDLLMHALRQEPNAQGVRRSKWAIVRGTFGQLKSTTIKTFQEWVPPKLCRIVYDSPIRGHIDHFPLNDGTFLDVEFLFMPLDTPDAIKNLLSLEITGAFVNEIAEINNPNILSDLQQRCDRFPPPADGVGATWAGVIADFNPPPRGSWLHKRVETDKDQMTSFYRMPPPLLVERDIDEPDDMSKIKFIDNPDAENVGNHNSGYEYWRRIAQANLHDWEYVKRFVLGEYPNAVGGRAVYPLFSESKHVLRDQSVIPQRGSLLMIGVDFGLTPACAICQFIDGRLVVLDEITTKDTSLTELIEEALIPMLRTKYVGYRAVVIGDPTGGGRDQYAKMHPKKLFTQYGLKYIKAPTNEFNTLYDTTNRWLRRRDGFYVMAHCEDIVSGFLGGYKWKDRRGSAMVRKPVKEGDEGWYSHVMDAVQQVIVYCDRGGQVFHETSPDPDSFSNLFPQTTPAGTAWIGNPQPAETPGYLYA